MHHKFYKTAALFLLKATNQHRQLRRCFSTIVVAFLAQVTMVNAQFAGISYNITDAGNPTEIFFPNNVLVSGNNTLDLSGGSNDLVIAINTTTNKISFTSSGASSWALDFDLVFLNGATVSSIALASSTGTNANRVLITRTSGSTIAFRRQGGNEVFGSFTVVYDFVPVTTTTWNGTTWSNAVPAVNVDAVIAGNTAPTSFSCKSLIINNSFSLNTNNIVVTTNGNIVNNGNGIVGTGVVNIRANSTISGNPITIAGRIDVGSIGSVTLTTGGLLRISPTGRISGSYTNISGSVTLQQNIVGQRGWRIFSNPFTTTQTISTLATNNGISISTTPSGASGLTDVRTYTNGTGWSNVTASTLAANRPYALFIRGLANEVTGLTYTGGPTAFTYNASGTLNGNTVTITPSASGFTLVGNPFAGPVNSSALTNGTGKSYFVYQIARSGDGRTRGGGWSVQLTSSTATPIPTLGVIAYQAGSATSYNLSNVTDINSSGTATTGFFRTQQTQQGEQQNQAIENLALVVEQNGVLQDNLFIRQDEASTSGTNDTKDLLKLTNDNVNFYTLAKATNQRLAVDARDVRKDSSRIPLGISAAQGEYTLKVSNNNIEKVTATLVDNYLQTKTELTSNTSYHFTITADSNSRGNNRFEVQFNNKLSTIIPTTTNNGFSAKVLGNSNVNNIVSVEVSNAQKQVTIIVMDVQGRVLATKQGANGVNRVQVNMSNGIHLVQVTDGNSVVTEKIMN